MRATSRLLLPLVALSFAVASLVVTAMNAQASSHFLSMKFSQKSQLKTGLRWMQHQPKLIRGTELAPIQVQANGASPPSRRSTAATTLPGAPEAFNSSALPYAAVGKLFFTKRNGGIATCSAAFAGGMDLIVTAAHCVLAADGEWNQDFLFIRAYGAEDQESYAVSCVAAPEEWGAMEGEAALAYDYAFLQTRRNSSVGSLGVANSIPPRELLLTGYSNNFRNGRRQLRFSAPSFLGPGGKLGTRNNPLEKGSSGMPWLGNSTVYSLTSHFHAQQDNIMWGPRFTQETMALMRYVSNGCEKS